jgi:Tfp pilus assembly protein PilX
MKKINKNQKGIALITTIILTSVMLSSIVLITKEMSDEVKNSTRLDNSMIAYYAAEAGLEDALLEFRYDHNSEISEQNDTTPTVDVTAVSNNTPRTIDISTPDPTKTRVTNSAIKNYNESYYEVTMWNKVSCLVTAGDPNPFHCATIPPLKSDNIYEFSIDNIGGNTVTLGFAPRNNLLKDELNNGYRLEVTVLDENGNILPPPAKRFTCPNEITQTISFNSASLGNPTGRKIFRIKPWYTQYATDCLNITPPSGALTTPANESPYIHLSVNKSPNAQLISGPITNIESVGFYGGVQRKIVASIDHSSGNIVGIFDYAIYSGSDLIK